MQPVKASGWFNSNLSEEDRRVLIKSGITPVNDIFYPLWGCLDPVVLLYGGYGSGKSVFIQTDLIEKSRQPEYFKCYYGRKVLEDVRGSIHSKFVSVIKDNGLEDEFNYSEQPNGSMIIRHKSTGNMFIPFGASNPESLKSIDDPTHFFLEEMDQFSQNDFALIVSRLRTTKGNLQLYGAFNTATVFDDHWIKKMLFPEVNEQPTEEDKEFAELIATMGIRKLFCNYVDNYFIDQQDYYNKLKLTAAGDKDYLESIANGEWGIVKGENPFAYQYTKGQHESNSAVFNPNRQLLISIDFNLIPFGVIFAQMWRDQNGEHLHIVDEASIQKGSIPAMIDLIKTRYRNQLANCIITGDAMGKRGNLSERDNASNYELLRRGLGLKEQQIQVPANPTHDASRNDVNYVLYHFPDFKVNPSKCINTSRDMRTVQVDAFGEILKKDRKDVNQRADHLDCVRYLINTFLRKWIDSNMKLKK